MIDTTFGLSLLFLTETLKQGRDALRMLTFLRKRSMLTLLIHLPDIMRNPTEKAFWHWHKTIFNRTACTCLTSLRPHYLHRDS